MGSQYFNKTGLILTLTLTIVMVGYAMEGSDKDREECAEQLVGLATCLPYVGGNAKAPTPDCCSGLKQVLKDNRKCLCVIIKDRNDPELGLKINVTLALGLPSVCHATANVSQCPALLHLAPNSPDAQVFYQFANSSNHSANSPPSLTDAGKATRSGNSQEGQSAEKLNSGYSGNARGWAGVDITSLLGFSLWWFLYQQLVI